MRAKTATFSFNSSHSVLPLVEEVYVRDEGAPALP